MNREFAPYEPSLNLKELGFDEPCFGYYLCKNSAFGVELELTTNWIDLLPYDSSSCKAPLYQQAFRWFREKYKLSGLIEISNQEYSFIIFDEEKDSRKITSSMNGTYEEAELACLKKLIETKNL